MAPKSEAPSPRPGGRSFGLLLGRSLFFVVMTTCALVSTVAQVRILDVNGQLLASKQSHQISVRPNRTLTDQPLTGTTSAIFNSSLGFALFTDLAFMQPASSVKLIFQCESCVNSGGTKLTIVSGSPPFEITPALHHLAYVLPRPGTNPHSHPNVAGQVSGLFVLPLHVFIPLFPSSSDFATWCKNVFVWVSSTLCLVLSRNCVSTTRGKFRPSVRNARRNSPLSCRKLSGTLPICRILEIVSSAA